MIPHSRFELSQLNTLNSKLLHNHLQPHQAPPTTLVALKSQTSIMDTQEQNHWLIMSTLHMFIVRGGGKGARGIMGQSGKRQN